MEKSQKKWVELIDELNETPEVHSAHDINVKLVGGLFMPAVLKYVHNNSDDVKKFYDIFDDPEKKKQRLIAATSLTYSNSLKIGGLISSLDMVNFLQTKRTEMEGPKEVAELKENRYEHMESVCEILSEAISSKDHKLFRRMSDILKEDKMAIVEDENGGPYLITLDESTARGGKCSVDGKIWASFCDLLINKITLPTKKEVRENAGISSEEAKKSFNNLGLSGLPHASNNASD